MTERIGKLTYRLEFPENMKIHDVISIAHFEPETDLVKNPYYSHRQFPPTVIINDQKKSEIKKLFQKRRIRKSRGWSIQYFARWFGYGPEYDQWIFEHRLNNARNFINDYEQTFGQLVKI